MVIELRPDYGGKSWIFHLQVTNLTNGCTSEDQTTVLQGPIAPPD